MDRGKVLEFLRQVPFLQRLPGSSLRKLAEVVQVKQYELGEYVVREGEIGDGIYFILEGQVEISGSASIEEGNHSDLLLKQYDYFGYESGGSIQQATVVALSQLTCLVLPDSYSSLLQPKSIWYADESPGGLSLMEHILCLEPLEALAAASKTVDCLKLVHSLHAMFILAGENNCMIKSGTKRGGELVQQKTFPISEKCKGYLTSPASSRVVLHTSSWLLTFACSLLTLLKHSKFPWPLPFSLVSVLGVCLCMLHLLGPFHDQALSLHDSKGSMTSRSLSSTIPWRCYAYGPTIRHLASASLFFTIAPIIYLVHRVCDGNSFATRRVDAKQNGYAIFTLFASFQKVEEGFEHQEVFLPHVPAPEMLLNIEELRERRLADPHLSMEYRNKIAKKKFIPWPIEIRFCEDYHFSEQSPPRFRYWLKVKGKLTDDPALHRCVLAYASDLIFGGISLNPHRRRGLKIASLSLDHSIWFHRSVRADDWLLFVIESPSASGGRGLSFGRMFNRRGELIMSLTQEGLIRKAKQQNEDLNSKL
ncbi:unnamed protein product [Musa acuminata var. zebrina]